MIAASITALLFLIVNATAFVLFMLDKHLAQERQRRISEPTLLFLALVGGSVGAIAGQQYWRHKTRKEPFRSVLFLIAGVQAMALALVVMEFAVPGVVTASQPMQWLRQTLARTFPLLG